MRGCAGDCWRIIVRRYSLLLLAGVSLSGDILLSDTESYTQEEARIYCRDLGSGWRQMEIKELFGASAPFKEGYSYWSANQGPSDTTVIGTGSEGDGGIIESVGYSFYPKERNITLSSPTKKIAAACTNTPLMTSTKGYIRTSAGIEERESGLIWQSLEATDKRAKYTFDNAKEHCETLTLGGREWRLPTLEELYGIVDYSRFRPTVDMNAFGPMMHRYYRTSDTLNESESYVVGFKLGSVATVSNKEEAYVRCVSD
jgi:hypothetical protein